MAKEIQQSMKSMNGRRKEEQSWLTWDWRFEGIGRAWQDKRWWEDYQFRHGGTETSSMPHSGKPTDASCVKKIGATV